MANTSLKDQIRFGTAPDNPQLIKRYLNRRPQKANSLAQQRAHYDEQFWLLLDTIADDCIAAHWRCICLDHIYVPLHALSELASCSSSKQYLSELKHELKIISHYFEASMTYTT